MAKRIVYVLAAEGEEELAEELARPLRTAGYGVTHNGTIAIGDSLIAEATRALSSDSPVVLCATTRAVGSAWTHQIVNASRVGGPPRVFVVLMDKNAYVDQLAVRTKVARYCDDPSRAVQELLDSLTKYFPVQIEAAADREPSGQSRPRMGFLDEPTGIINFDIQAMEKFRNDLRPEMVSKFPPSLTPWEFLYRADLWVNGSLSRTGALLFGEQPGLATLTSIVKCVEYLGIDRSAERNAVTFEGTVPQQIDSARNFIAERVRRGEAPDADAVQSVDTYDLPMI